MSRQIPTPPDLNGPVPPDLSNISGLTSLLSASSYSEREPLAQQSPGIEDGQKLLYGGYSKAPVGNAAGGPRIDRTTTTGPSGHTIPQENSAARGKDKSGTKKRSQKKRGRPRKDNDDPAEPQEERRRKQIRIAQRAYREREKGVVSQHEVRIAQLETSIKQMNCAISSFGEQLAKSGVVESHANLQVQLLNTLATCKSIIKETGLATEEEQLTPSTQSDESPQSQEEQSRISNASTSVQLHERQRYPSLIPSPLADISLQDFSSPLGHGSPLLFDNMTTTTITTVDLPLFIRQLRIACAYYAFFSLRDSSNKLDDLRKKFRFLLSILSRENLMSYFEAGLIAKTHPERMLEWEELPFFRVGGAGTHFLQSSPSLYNNQYAVWEDPLSEFPSDIQGEMDGRWYDIQDLEGFLQERGVQLLADSPTRSRQGLMNPVAVGASDLTKALVRSSICLGRSPGWRPIDVEMALQISRLES